jgi:hypothetical protein
MVASRPLAFGVTGLLVGIVATHLYMGAPRPITAASNDRYQDYILATGAVSVKPGVQTDGVWMLDYRTGKLLGTVIDKTQGKIVGWAEVELAQQFDVKPLQDVHFMMVTGYVTQGQSALYVAETTTGKFGVFTMGPGPGNSGVVIRQHDMTSFRPTANVPGLAAPASPAVVPGVPVAVPVPASVPAATPAVPAGNAPGMK